MLKSATSKGRSPKAKRYDSTQTDEERHGFDNLIVMCGTHHTTIDQDDRTYTVERLCDMKRLHEGNKTQKFTISDAEAQRLALVAGGAAFGVIVAELAKSMNQIVDAFAGLFPEQQKTAAPRAIPYSAFSWAASLLQQLFPCWGLGVVIPCRVGLRCGLVAIEEVSKLLRIINPSRTATRSICEIRPTSAGSTRIWWATLERGKSCANLPLCISRARQKSKVRSY